MLKILDRCSTWVIAVAAAVSVVAAFARPVVAQTSRPALSPEVLRQIEASQREKVARTPAERKIDSRLLNEMARRQGGPAASRPPGAPVAALAQDAAGRVIVDITTTAAAVPALRADVARRGGEVLSRRLRPAAPASQTSPARTSSLRASVSLDRLRRHRRSPGRHLHSASSGGQDTPPHDRRARRKSCPPARRRTASPPPTPARAAKPARATPRTSRISRG